MNLSKPLGLFEATGIEIEYMVVDRASLDVRPIVDELLRDESGEVQSEVERDEMAWSNELAMHVVELKTNGPTTDLAGAAELFQREVGQINRRLAGLGAMLMSGAAHPWMDPARELEIWPHEYDEIYRTYDRIFGCRSHGWANLQSMHVNLPFADDREFARLHAAIRFVLPIMPALAASSPVLAGRSTKALDSRLEVYRNNAGRFPSIAGEVVPEAVFTRASYEREILEKIYLDLAAEDPEGILRYEWVNSRGCIARFDRMAIEIRVLDVQECPAADLALAIGIVAVLRRLVESDALLSPELRSWPTARLVAILDDVIRAGDRALIADRDYLRLLGFREHGGVTALDLWARLIEDADGWSGLGSTCERALRVILNEGCLSRRLLERIAGDERREHLREVYGEVAGCLAAGKSFRGGA